MRVLGDTRLTSECFEAKEDFVPSPNIQYKIADNGGKAPSLVEVSFLRSGTRYFGRAPSSWTDLVRYRNAFRHIMVRL